MVSDTHCENTHFAGKILTAVGGEGVKKPESLAQRRQAVSSYRPISNFIMDRLRPHIVDILGVILPAFCLGHTDELAGLIEDIA